MNAKTLLSEVPFCCGMSQVRRRNRLLVRCRDEAAQCMIGRMDPCRMAGV